MNILFTNNILIHYFRVRLCWNAYSRLVSCRDKTPQGFEIEKNRRNKERLGVMWLNRLGPWKRALKCQLYMTKCLIFVTFQKYFQLINQIMIYGRLHCKGQNNFYNILNIDDSIHKSETREIRWTNKHWQI